MTATEILREEVKHYVDNADDKSLRMALAILKIEQGEDWQERVEEAEEDWDGLPKEFQQILEESIRDADEGRVISHADVMKKHSKWFRK